MDISVEVLSHSHYIGYRVSGNNKGEAKELPERSIEVEGPTL